MNDIFELPETLEQVRQYIELADDVYLHGFSRRFLLRRYVARYHETGDLRPWCDFLRLVQDGQFDYLLKDASGQSFS